MTSLSGILRRNFCTTSAPARSIESLSREMYKERSLKKLVEKFKQHSEIKRFRTKSGIYEFTVHRLACAKRFRWIEEILEDQKKYRDISKEGFSVRLISLYGKSGMFDHACKVFDEMPERKCEQTVKSFNALLGACVNSGKFDKVDGFFKEFPKKLSVMPDVVSYNTMIKAFCEMKSLDLALKIFDEMMKKGLDPDLITFNTLLDALYKNNRFLDGEKMWARMEEKNVVPNIITYNSKLFVLGSENRMLEAVELFRSLEAKGLKPDVFSYNALIEGYCKQGNLEEVKNTYAELVRSKHAPNKATFSSIVPLALEKGDLTWAFKMCKEIINRRCLVDVALLQNVVDGLAKDSQMEEAKKLVEIGNSNNYSRYNLTLPSDKL